MHALTSRLKLLSAPQLSDLLWSLAELGLQPGAELLARFEEEAAGKLLALAPPARLARAVVTLVRLGRPLDGAALLLAMDELQPAALPADALGDLLWALARMRFKPGGYWVGTAAARVLEAGSASGSSSGGVSSGSGCVDRRSRSAAGLSPFHWARSLQGLAGLGARPGAPWVLAAARQTQARLQVLTGEQLLTCSRALAALAPEAAGEVAVLLGMAPQPRQQQPRQQQPQQQQQQQQQEGKGDGQQQAVEQAADPQPAITEADGPVRPVLKRPVMPKHVAR